jgi:hypothetical protein
MVVAGWRAVPLEFTSCSASSEFSTKCACSKVMPGKSGSFVSNFKTIGEWIQLGTKDAKKYKIAKISFQNHWHPNGITNSVTATADSSGGANKVVSTPSGRSFAPIVVDVLS